MDSHERLRPKGTCTNNNDNNNKYKIYERLYILYYMQPLIKISSYKKKRANPPIVTFSRSRSQ